MTTLNPMAPVAVEAEPPPTRRRGIKNLSFDRVSLFLVFLGIPLALYAIFVVSPFIQAVGYSFTDWAGFSASMNYVGFDNYVRIAQDPLFLKALRNNIILAVVLPLSIVVLSLVLATMITVAGRSVGEVKGLKGAGFYRVISFFPYAIPAIVVGIMWGQIFDPSNGLVNGVLTRLGFEQFKSFPWLGDTRAAMPVSIFIIVWGFIGFYMILFIAAIKGIPSEIYEAARIDGAGRFRTAWTITLPLIRENVQTAYIYLGIMAIDAYVYMQALNPFGGPDNSTLVMAQYLMTTAFDRQMFGVACAMGVVMGLLTAVFAAIVFTVNRLTGGKDQVTMA